MIRPERNGQVDCVDDRRDCEDTERWRGAKPQRQRCGLHARPFLICRNRSLPELVACACPNAATHRSCAVEAVLAVPSKRPQLTSQFCVPDLETPSEHICQNI